LGGQQLISDFVTGLDMSPLMFLIVAQIIIFILGWPLEWTEIIVIFVPIFLPLLAHFEIDPLFFGVLVAVNLQTAFLSPPMAMSAYYLKGISPPHVQLSDIFRGMMPYMLIVILCMVIIYIFPQIVYGLPNLIYGG
ncbi:MAG: TRAP transporter large permease subunit, partial [Mesorhizobium sp.]